VAKQLKMSQGSWTSGLAPLRPSQHQINLTKKMHQPIRNGRLDRYWNILLRKRVRGIGCDLIGIAEEDNQRSP